MCSSAAEQSPHSILWYSCLPSYFAILLSSTPQTTLDRRAPALWFLARVMTQVQAHVARAQTFLSLHRYLEALDDALLATHLDPDRFVYTSLFLYTLSLNLNHEEMEK